MQGFAAGLWWHRKLVCNSEATNDQLFNFETSNACAPDNQATDGDGADGQCSDCDGADGKGSDCAGAGCQRTDGS